MRNELAAQGKDVAFVSINMDSATQNQAALVSKCAFPLLQDLGGNPVWSLFGGKKDDIFVFDADGKKVAHLPFAGEINSNLSEEEGYQNLLQAVLGAEP